MKKLITLILAVSLLLGCVGFAAAEEMPAVITDANGNPVDLGGMEIIIGDWWSSGEVAEPNNAQEEAQQEYREWIQETYNFKIKQVAVCGWEDNAEAFTNFATTGGEENYVYILRPDCVGAPLRNGLLYDLASLDCLDFTAKKWNGSTKEMTSKGDSVYGMTVGIEPRFGLFFNKRVLEEADIDPESIYDMQASGEWTWAKFEEIMEKTTRDTDNDGVTDVYGMVIFNMEWYTNIVASNEGKFFDVDENGQYYIAVNSDATLEALNWAYEMNGKYARPQGDDEWNYYVAAFNTGEAAFTTGQDYQAGGDFNAMEDDFGFVFYPKGPKAEHYQMVSNENVAVIPAIYDAERAWKIAFAYNLYTNPTPGYEDEDEGWKDGYYSKYRDDRAVDETLTMMRTNENVVGWVNNLLDGWNNLLGQDFIWSLGSITVAEGIEAKTPAWQSYVDIANGVS